MSSSKKTRTEENTIIENITTGQERAFYGSKNVLFKNITIKGIEQGESAFKECRNITIEDSTIYLNYCIWHCINLNIYRTTIDGGSRASLWYCDNVDIADCKLYGVKECRNCTNLKIKDSEINSDEFGWHNEGVKLINCKLFGVYHFLSSSNITMDNVEVKAKYIFQYSNNINLYNVTIDTKDCLWHAKNAYCKNCTFTGEYLAWYSENVVLENCHIDSIQPLCYCKKLKLINCTMKNSNLAFEYSDVEADIHSHVDSIRDVLSGKIIVDSLGEYVQDEHVYDCKGIVETRNKK